MDRHKLIAYTEAYLSFLLAEESLWKNEVIKQIILFGSVVRNEFTDTSDIDLFIELYDDAQKELVRTHTSKALASFSKSQLAKEWSLRGVKNELAIQIGTLQQMSDLKRSLISDGIILYGKYAAKTEAEHYVLIHFAPIKEKNKRYRVDRYLFGRAEASFSTEGIIKQLGGKRLSTRVFILPSKQAPTILKHLKEEKVNFAMHEIWSDTL